MARELSCFASLYRSDRTLWLAAWLMHFALALIVVGHLVGIGFLGRQFTWLGISPAASTLLSHVLGTIAGLLLTAALLGLFFRRAIVAEVKTISDPVDYFDLLLLLAVAVTGLGMRLPAAAVDLVQVRAYVAGLLVFQPPPLPGGWMFVSHFTLVNLLLLHFPFSKLVHATGAIVNRALLVQSPPRYPTPSGVALSVPFPAAKGSDPP